MEVPAAEEVELDGHSLLSGAAACSRVREKDLVMLRGGE
jgi:hypothetical protein